jgi:putative transcriptional regulator
MNSLQGKLLVSSPALIDPNFRKTVVLITHHDEEGAMGLVLSRPSQVAAVEAVPGLRDVPGGGDPVFVGGPVHPDAFMAVAEFEDVNESAAQIFGDIGFLPAQADPSELDVRHVRLFAGYAGWGPGQLEMELEEPSWIVVVAEAGDPFADDPDELWRAVIHRKGGPFSLMENMPFDPGLN